MFGLGMLKGLSVTMRHFIESYIYDRKPWEPRYNEEWLEKHQAIDGKGLFTIQYPEQKRKITENFRFIPMLVYEETTDDPRCTACGICARVCPPQCIWIQRATDDKGRPKAQPAGFWIDATICMSCGFCAEFCPFDAIKMNQEHEMPYTDRDQGHVLRSGKAAGPRRVLCRAASQRLCARGGSSPGQGGGQAAGCRREGRGCSGQKAEAAKEAAAAEAAAAAEVRQLNLPSRTI